MALEWPREGETCPPLYQLFLSPYQNKDFKEAALLVHLQLTQPNHRMPTNYQEDLRSLLGSSGGFKGGPEGAQAHPVIGLLLITC